MTLGISDWATSLCLPLVRSTQMLARLVVACDDTSIEEFETAVEEVKQSWHDLMLGQLTVAVGRGYDRKWAPGIVASDWDPFFRMMVAFAGVVSASSAWVSSRLGTDWGDHIFAAADFPLLTYDSISCVLPPNAVTVLMPEATGDFAGAFIDVSNLGVAVPVKLQAQVQLALEEMCAAVGAFSPVSGLGFRCWSQSEVQSALVWTSAEVDDAVAQRKLVSVESWAGELEFPDFQFRLGHTATIHAWVAFVLAGTPDSFEGWPLAIWLSRNRAKPEGFYEEKLTDRGLWTAAWGQPPVGIFAKEEAWKIRTAIDSGADLWRVSPSAITPFRFAQADMPSPGSIGKMRPAGRFDVDRARSDLGSLYLAETPLGAWSEVLDREPVVTLRHLTNRDAWRLKPHRGFVLVDLDGAGPKVCTTSRRADTQDLATKYAIAGHQGLRACLRTGGGRSIVLFGTGGKRLPSSGGLGGWSAKRIPGVQGEPLWDYLADRMEDPDLATVLRRLPGDLKLLN